MEKSLLFATNRSIREELQQWDEVFCLGSYNQTLKIVPLTLFSLKPSWLSG